jgi:putative membrane protein
MNLVQLVLANERTYLAYVRTALALMAAGVAIVQFGDNLGGKTSARLVGTLILGGGIMMAVLGYARWRDNDSRIAKNEALRATQIPLLLTIATTTFGIIVLVLAIF